MGSGTIAVEQKLFDSSYQFPIMGTISDVTWCENEEDLIEAEAEKLDLDKTEYIRQRFRVGRLVWKTSNIDGEALTKLTKREELNDLLSGQQDSDSSSTTSTDSIPNVNEKLIDDVLREIPTENSGDGVTVEELKRAIFGTEEDREQAISQAIESLYGDDITRRADGKVVKYD